jgi:hypothetical protein
MRGLPARDETTRRARQSRVYAQPPALRTGGCEDGPRA